MYFNTAAIGGHTKYRIVGNFQGRKLLQIGGNFVEKFLWNCTNYVRACPQNFAEKTFADGLKTVKFVKDFSLKVSRYTV